MAAQMVSVKVAAFSDPRARSIFFNRDLRNGVQGGGEGTTHESRIVCERK